MTSHIKTFIVWSLVRKWMAKIGLVFSPIKTSIQFNNVSCSYVLYADIEMGKIIIYVHHF